MRRQDGGDVREEVVPVVAVAGEVVGSGKTGDEELNHADAANGGRRDQHGIDEDQLRLGEGEAAAQAAQPQVPQAQQEQDKDRAALERLLGPQDRLDDDVAVDAEERGGRDQQRPEERRAPGRRARGGGRLFTGGGTRAEWRRRGHD